MMNEQYLMASKLIEEQRNSISQKIEQLDMKAQQLVSD